MAETELLALGVLIVGAAAAHLIARFLKAPPFALLIAAGFAARPILPDGTALLEFILFLSLTFVLFAAGVSLHPARFSRATFPPIVAVGLGSALVTAVPAALVAYVAGWPATAIPYAAAAVALSSTLVVLGLLAARGEMADAHGRLLVGALLVQDALALLLFAIVPNVPDAPMAAAVQTLGILGLAALASLGTRLARLHAFWHHLGSVEVRVLTAFGLVFGFMLLAQGIGVPTAAGAFLAGLAVSPFPANVQLRPAVRAAREFFTPLFFVILGALVAIPRPADLPVLAALVVLVTLVKPLVVAFISRFAGFTRRASAETGALAGQGSEFALILATAGFLAGQLTENQFAILVFTVAISMLLTPLLMNASVGFLSRTVPRDRTAPAFPRADHVVVLGAGTTGAPLVGALNARGWDVVVVDVDPHALAQIPPDTPRIQGDAKDPDVLEAAHVRDARAVILLLRSHRATHWVLQRVNEATPRRERHVIARAPDAESARIVEGLGAHPLVAQELVADVLARDIAAHERDAGAASP